MEERIFIGSYSTIVFAKNLAFTSLLFSSPYIFPSILTHTLDFNVFPYTSLRHCSYFYSIFSICGLDSTVSIVISVGSVTFFPAVSYLLLNPCNEVFTSNT